MFNANSSSGTTNLTIEPKPIPYPFVTVKEISVVFVFLDMTSNNAASVADAVSENFPFIEEPISPWGKLPSR